MSENGKQTLVSVTLEEGKMEVDFASGVNMAMISHALRMANLAFDNALIGQQAAANESNIKVANSVIDRMRQ